MSIEACIGDIFLFAGPFAPRDWAFCDGQILEVRRYNALFSVIGKAYGGDGESTFALPDLRGRAPIHYGSGPNLTPRPIASKGGSESVPVNIPVPYHTHDATFAGTPLSGLSVDVATSMVTGNRPDGGGNILATYRSTPSATPGNLYINPADAGSKGKLGGVTTTGGKPDGTIKVDPAGQNTRAPVMQPWIGINYIICLEGSYPVKKYP